MVRELIISDQLVEIKYKKKVGVFFLISTCIVCFGIGIFFMSIPFFDNPDTKRPLYFGALLTICGLIGLLKLPSQLKSIDRLLEFSADSKGIKYNPRVYEKGKLQSYGWEEISKIVLTKKLISKTSFGSSNYSWNNLMIYFQYQNPQEIRFIQNQSKRIFKSPESNDLTVLKFPKGYEVEFSEALTFFAKKRCAIYNLEKVIFDYRTNEEEYVS